MLLACAAPLMALRLVSFAGGELAAAAQVAGGGHVLSRSSGFAARQVSRQMGGKLSLASLGSHKPALVQSSPEPNIKQLQNAGEARSGQNLKNDGGQLVSSGGNQPSGSETKTYGQPYVRRAGTPHRNPAASPKGQRNGTASGAPTAQSGAGSRPRAPQAQGGAVREQQVPKPVPPSQAPKPHAPPTPRPAPIQPSQQLPRQRNTNLERDKDV